MYLRNPTGSIALNALHDSQEDELKYYSEYEPTIDDDVVGKGIEACREICKTVSTVL